MNDRDLIFVELVVDKLVGSLLLERNDDESDEDVDEEERKDNEVDDVEDCHFHAEVGLRALILVRRVHRVDQHAETKSSSSIHLFRSSVRSGQGVQLTPPPKIWS